MLATALMGAPIVGVGDEAKVVHRVNADGLPVRTWATADAATAVCGAAVRLVPIRWVEVRTRNTEWSRCKPCREWRNR